MKKHIIFLVNSPYPHYTGGRETWITEVSNRLIKEYDISIVSTHQRKYDEMDGVITNLDDRVKIYHAKSMKSFYLLQKIDRSYVDFLNEIIIAKNISHILKKIIEQEQKTIIIALDSVFLPMAWRRIDKKNVKRIISFRGKHLEIYQSYWRLMNKTMERIEKKNLDSTDDIWVNGYDTELYVKNKGYASKVILNGVDCESFFQFNTLQNKNDIEKEWRPMVFTVGSLLDLKGYPEMIKCINQLNEKYGVSAHLVSYGKGNQSKYLQLADELGVKDNIHFMGERRGAAVFAKDADVVLLLGTSIGGGMSMAALELLATGTVAVAWNNECYQQLINNGENGFLVDEGDVDRLTDVVYERLQNLDGLNAIIGTNAQKRVMKNDWSNVIDMIKHQIEGIANDQKTL